MDKKLLLIILIIGLISACGTQPMEIPASQSTEVPAAATQALTKAPAFTDTAVPTDTASPITDTPAAQTTTTVSFSNDVLPLLQNRCKNCHGGNKTEEGLNLLSYTGVMNGSNNGLVVVPGNVDDSLLAELLLNQKMPKRGPKLTLDQTQLIITWINEGALDN